tara:strand:- start:534 stop:899 length:366 start_codon:yes stop_codon:yes gene_type:complete
MAKPQFKNSSMRLNTDIAVTDKISISFWFNIDDQALVEQLERYYVMTGNKPNLQYQRKDGDSYTTVASSNLFIPDERAAELKNIAPPEVSQSEPLPDQIPSDNSFDGVTYGGGAGVFPGSN